MITGILKLQIKLMAFLLQLVQGQPIFEAPPTSLSVHISWTRLASFCHLGFISDPLIVSKFNNETHDPKGQESKIYTIVNLGQPTSVQLKGKAKFPTIIGLTTKHVVCFFIMGNYFNDNLLRILKSATWLDALAKRMS